MIRFDVVAAWLVMSMQSATAALPDDIDRIGWPEAMRLSVVAEHMRINGVDHRIYAFESPDGADRIAAHLRREWHGRMRRAQVPPWDIVTHRDRNLLVAVQMRSQPDGGTQGLVSFSNVFDILDGRARAPESGVPLPPATRLHQTIDADDAGIRSRTVVLHSDLPPAQPLDFYLDYFRAQGFLPISGASLQRNESGGVLVLNRGATQANVATATRGGKTVVTIVTVHP